MLKKTMEAVFEDGVFRPLKRPKIPEKQQVRLTVEIPSKESVEEYLALAGRVYEGLSEQDVTDVERIALDRRDFFRGRTL